MLFSQTKSPNSSVFGLFLLAILALAGDGNADALAFVGFFQNQNVARSSSSRRVCGCHQQLFKSPATERETKTATASLSFSLSLKSQNDDEIENVRREDESTKQAIERIENEIAAVVAEIKDVEKKIEKAEIDLEKKVDKVEKEIATVVADIKQASQNVLDNVAPGQDYWIDEKKRLTNDKEDLRDEKKQLRDKEDKEKQQLRDKEKELRDEKKQLRDRLLLKEQQLIDEKNKFKSAVDSGTS